MEYVDLVSLGSFLALFLGVLMLTGGLYARRRGRLHTRQGAAVLAGFSTILGVTFLVAGLIAFLGAYPS